MENRFNVLGTPMRATTRKAGDFGTVWVALPEDDLVVARNSTMSALALSLLITPALMLLLGWWLGKRALAELGRAAELADRIDPSKSLAMLPLPDREDEVHRLLTAINRLLVRIVREADAAVASGVEGAVGELLRREGLYSSHLTEWRKQRDGGSLAGLAATPGVAVAIGIVDGVGYGENTKASIITRGLVEMTDFAVAQGAQHETLQGLAGLGDLIATCQSPLSRNNTAGRLLGQGYSFQDVVKQMNQTAEGLASVAPVLQLARESGVAMPIVEQVKRVLDGTMNPRDIAPHLTTDDDRPTGERTQNGQDGGGGAFRRSLQRALDQFRNGRGRAAGD